MTDDETNKTNTSIPLSPTPPSPPTVDSELANYTNLHDTISRALEVEDLRKSLLYELRSISTRLHEILMDGKATTVTKTTLHMLSDRSAEIFEYLDWYLKAKPWGHMKRAIYFCCLVSPTALSLILNDALEGGGRITHAVFGKRPHEVPHYYAVYPLDILLYAVRIDTMLNPDLKPHADAIFRTISEMDEFKLFKDAIKEFIT